ncbi:MAG TPA: DUF1360 domain-containing protein [Solirubrobacter sp.]|nr:DUF1360 domain-containing protein [Solirubrobacter sp.]
MTTTDLPGDLGTGYAADAEDQRPLAGYAILSGAFAAALAGGLLAGRDRLPERVPLRDVVLGGIATHKLSRLLGKDKVSSFIRAPFTRFQEKSGHGELEEAARGSGLRYATGELLVCPYCLAQWIAGALAVGYVHAPRTTRVLAAMSTMHFVSDALQLAYTAAEEKA